MLNGNSIDKLVEAAIDIKDKAYAPYSHFKVGAAILCKDGSIIAGCNVENASYGATICAERSALCSAITSGKSGFEAIAIVGSGDDFCYPCGICRQVLSEFNVDMDVFSLKSDGSYIVNKLNELLPNNFGAKDLIK